MSWGSGRYWYSRNAVPQVFGGECAEALCEEEDANYGDAGLGILMVRVWRLVLGGARGKGGGEFVVTC